MRTTRSGPERLTNGELKAHLKNPAASERAQLIEWLEHLAEMDRRRAYLADGASSLFAWCRENLLLSEWAAHARIRAARAMRKYPVLTARLKSGELHLDTVARLAPHLTPDNHVALLDEARFAPRRVIDAIVARFQPEASRRTRIVVRARGVTSAGGASPALPLAGTTVRGGAPVEVAAAVEVGAPAAEEAAAVKPEMGTPLEYRVHLTISARAHDDLERLRELMRHQVPDGEPAEIVELALRVLRRQVEVRAGARLSNGPGRRDAVVRASGRHIPIAVRRAVRKRDGERCAFRSREGRVCGERAWLEFHHVVPHARGGTATAGNIELRCRAHNRYESEREFDGQGPAGPCAKLFAS